MSIENVKHFLPGYIVVNVRKHMFDPSLCLVELVKIKEML